MTFSTYSFSVFVVFLVVFLHMDSIIQYYRSQKSQVSILSQRDEKLEKSYHTDTQSNISSVVEFGRWWVLKSKIFGQKAIYSKETIVF